MRPLSPVPPPPASSDFDLVNKADVILPAVPPPEVLSTAQRIAWVSTYSSRPPPPTAVLHRPHSTRPYALQRKRIAALFVAPSLPGPAPRFLDGAVPGAPPLLLEAWIGGGIWKKPRIVVSGAHNLDDERLAEILNMRSVGPTAGMASALKCCDSRLIMEITALTLQNFASATT